MVHSRHTQWVLGLLRSTSISVVLLISVSCGGGGDGSATVSSVPPPPSTTAPIAALDKWHPGIYAKVEDWQLRSPAHMETVFQELATTPQLRGIKVVLLWGRYETRDVTSGRSTFDFSQIDEILSRLAALHDKHLILAFAWREFDGTKGASDVLPADLAQGTLWTDPDPSPPDWTHTAFDSLWATKLGHQPGKYAYNLKLWSPAVLARVDTFLEKLSEHVDMNPHLTHIATTETASGEPVIPFDAAAGESLAAHHAGQLAVMRLMKKHFVHTPVFPALNYERTFVASVVPLLERERFGLGTPNSNLNSDLNRTLPAAAPGVLTYFPALSGRVALAPEIQGDEYERTFGAGTPIDHPSYERLYLRVRNDLKANYTVMQRTYPYWRGNPTTSPPTPGMLEFIQTYPTIIHDPTGAGGLDAVKPLSLR